MKLIHYLLLFIIFLSNSCKTTEISTTKSNATELTSLVLTGISGSSQQFDKSTNTYTFTVPTGTNIKALPLTFILPAGATASPVSGSSQDFTNPVTYTIIAENGTTIKYVIKVVVQSSTKSSAKQILSFSFDELNPVVKATINQSTFEITAEVPASVNIKALKPTITLSNKATVSPATGVSQDFTNAVKYTVTAEDGSKQEYNIKITIKVSSQIDIYVAGELRTSPTVAVPVYWKNGVLNMPSTLSSPNNYLFQIFINNDDVYVCGSSLNKNGKSVATYWKNGTPTALSDGLYNNSALSMSVINNDVYVTGFSSETGKAKYWKNGAEIILPSDANSSSATSIVVDNGNIYVAGYDVGINYTNAVYWLNGKKYILPDSEKRNTYANNIIIKNNDVYVSGGTHHETETNLNGKAKYWKNGNEVNLTDGTNSAMARSMFIDGNDIYVCGQEYNNSVVTKGVPIAKYWKNGVPISLGKKSSSASSIVIFKGDVYVAGEEVSDSGKGNAKYWKNGVEVNLKDSGFGSRGFSLIVK